MLLRAKIKSVADAAQAADPRKKHSGIECPLNREMIPPRNPATIAAKNAVAISSNLNESGDCITVSSVAMPWHRKHLR